MAQSSRLFAYTATSSTSPSGATQVGNILIGGSRFDPVSGYTWYMGPDESRGHIIARTTSIPRTYPIPDSSERGTFSNPSIRFGRSDEKTSLSFTTLVNSMFKKKYNDTYSAKYLIDDLQHWTSFSNATFSVNEFVTTWFVQDTLDLPIGNSDSPYNYTVYWGDGSSNNYRGATASHRYSTPDYYTVKIIGDLPTFNFRDSTLFDGSYLTSIINWGKQKWTQINFANSAQLYTIVATDTPNISSADLSDMFSGCSLLSSINTSNWNVGTVSNMSGMFSGCVSLENIDVSNWSVSNVENMSSMFFDCVSLTNLNVSNWNVSTCSDMSNMFANTGILSLTVSTWNVSNVTTMNSMFFRSSSLTSIDISDWDVSSVQDMEGMFADVTLDTVMYSNTLINWSGLSLQSNVLFNAGNSQYNSSATASRQSIIDNYNWTISDLGEST